MNKHLTGLTVATFSIIPALIAGESVADKPQGFRFFNQHLTIKPYVALSYTYDSNIDTARHAEGDSIFCIQPGADFDWKGDRWALVGSLWYRRNAYCKYSNEMGENSFGESLAYKWTTSKQDERGWSLILAEQYRYIDQSDALGSGDGRGVWRDRETFDASGVLQRRFTERLHAELQGQYNWIDYKNDTGKYAPLYGWSEYSVGAQAGYASSKWTDFLIAGGYSHYRQKKGHGYRNYSNESQVWTVQAGLGSHATEKITYRALMGASWLDYGGHSNADCGWTYSFDANWRVTRQLQVSALGKSYYQPSERTVGQAVKVYSLSGGLSYLTLGDKMTLSANLAWRYEDTCYNDRYLGYGNDFDEQILSARVGANYTINRWMSVFAQVTWEEEWCDVKAYGYDRFRGTIGMRFHY